MKTLYAACLARLGLSHAGAARLHNARPDTVSSWASGRNPVPQGAWDDLRAYSGEIEDAADEFLAQWDQAGQPTIDIDTTEASDKTLMAAASFVLATDSPIVVGRTRATETARQARRPN